MTAAAAFCAATVVFLAARDLLVSDVRDVAVFALGAHAFWRARPWAARAAAAYLFYVALSHLIWSEASPHGHGWPAGLVQALAICAPALALWRADLARHREA